MTSIRTWLLCIGALTLPGLDLAADAELCTTESRIPIVLRHAATGTTATTFAAYLIGGLTPVLRIVEATGGRVLWTGRATGAPTQLFPDMTAGFSSSLAAIDTDGDGVHDRIYAGDLQGRLWRFDIDSRAPPSRWVTGGVFANLSGGAPGRGFLAAPDLTLLAPEGVDPWLSIALGTANTGDAAGFNRLYVVRDREPFAHWTQRQYDQWRPLLESDLLLAEETRLNTAPPESNGFYINLGARQVVATALTLDGHTFFTVAATSASLLPTCDTPALPVATIVDVQSISVIDGSLNAVDLQTREFLAPADSAISLLPDENSATGGFTCAVAGHRLQGCWVDTKLRRSFWRREDAD